MSAIEYLRDPEAGEFACIGSRQWFPLFWVKGVAVWTDSFDSLTVSLSRLANQRRTPSRYRFQRFTHAVVLATLRATEVWGEIEHTAEGPREERR